MMPVAAAGKSTVGFAQNEDGVQAMLIRTIDGQSLVTAEPGNDLLISNTVQIIPAVNEAENSGFYFLNLPVAAPVSINGGQWSLVNAGDREQLVSYSSGQQLAAGYYKIQAAGTTPVNVSYSYGIGTIQYNYYNQLGQLVASIRPEGVKKLLDNGLPYYANKESLPFTVLYEYDVQGRLISSSDSDTGNKSDFIYREDGSLRFSQNSLQRSKGRFSYSNYDVHGRVTEGGEYQPSAGGIGFGSSEMKNILESVTSNGGLINGVQYDVVRMKYDVTDNSHGLAGYEQDSYFMRGGVSVSEKYQVVVNTIAQGADLLSRRWYNYDGEGNLLWDIVYSSGPGYKTNDYSYDERGNIIKHIYQKNVPSETFVHYYNFDADMRLSTVHTSLTDQLSGRILQAGYQYYMHGPLKRVELGDRLQGIDYVYNIDGQLKTINHSNVIYDPGKDGFSNGFAPDVFGMNLEYYPGDYKRNGTNISSMQAGGTMPSYAGLVNGQSWFSRKPASVSGLNAPVMNAYTYDRRQQLTSSNWGVPDYASNSFLSSGNMYGENGLSYDRHGNLLSLRRTNASGGNIGNYNYAYAANSNRLISVPGYADYTYDAIGQLSSQVKDGAGMYLDYDASGKVSKIYSDAGKSVLILSFVYDESGNRIRKQDHRTGSVTYYVYDAGGSLMAVYDNAGGALRLVEQPVYGAGRIGIYYRQANNYQYTLTDHLGNTRVVINRNKLSNGEADVVYYADYYPFGMVLRSGGVEGRYGYQGQYAEKDGETGWNNFELRNYDAAIGRWLTVDPYGQYYSPYVGMGNNPVSGVDPDGGFSTWLGAKIWAMFNGGGSISKTDEGIYKVSQSTESSVRIVGGWSSGLGPVNISRSYSAPAGTSNFKRDPAYGPWMGPEFGGRTSRTRRTMLKENDYKFFEDAVVLPHKNLESTEAYTLPISGDFNGQKINGVIHISPEFYSKFDRESTKDLLRHEYGHILQRRLLGADRWWINVAGASLYSAATKGGEHQKSWTEVQANKLSFDYFGQPSDWNKKSYPVTDSIYFK